MLLWLHPSSSLHKAAPGPAAWQEVKRGGFVPSGWHRTAAKLTPSTSSSASRASTNPMFWRLSFLQSWGNTRVAAHSSAANSHAAADGSHPQEVLQEAAVPAQSPPTHLIVMVNGLFGSPGNWDVIKEELAEQLTDQPALLHASQVNQRTATYDGIDVCGQRLADEVRSLVARHPDLTRISFLAHSMGGLLARYAIGALYQPTSGTICGLRPCHFISMATPHMGCDAEGPAQVPFIGWTASMPVVGERLRGVLQELSAPTASVLFKRTGQQFFLVDGGGQPAAAAGAASGTAAAGGLALPLPIPLPLQGWLQGLQGTPLSGLLQPGSLVAGFSSQATGDASTVAVESSPASPTAASGAMSPTRSPATSPTQSPAMSPFRSAVTPGSGSSSPREWLSAASSSPRRALSPDPSSSRSSSQPPLLVRMTQDDPERGLYFYSGLAAFRTRTAYANVDGDHLVGWANSSLRAIPGLPELPPLQLAKAKGVVYEDGFSAAFYSHDWERVEAAGMLEQLQQQQSEAGSGSLKASSSSGGGGREQAGRAQGRQQPQAAAAASRRSSFEGPVHIWHALPDDGDTDLMEPQQPEHRGGGSQQQLQLMSKVAAGAVRGAAAAAGEVVQDAPGVGTDLAAAAAAAASQASSSRPVPQQQQQQQEPDDEVREQAAAAAISRAGSDLQEGLSQAEDTSPAGSPEEATAAVAAEAAAGGGGAAAAAAGSSQQPQAATGRAGDVQVMLRRLQELPWRRVDVSFGGAAFGFAHNNIQVTRRWLNWEGRGVTRHLAQQLVQLDALVVPLMEQEQGQVQQEPQEQPQQPQEH